MELQAVPNCPVCGATERRLLHEMSDQVAPQRTERWHLWRCAACATAWIDPRPTDAALSEAYAGYYTRVPPGVEPDPVGAVARARRALRNGYVNAELGYTLDSAVPKAAAKLIMRALPHVRGQVLRSFRHLEGRGRVLDVGCANGTFVVQATRAGWGATGIDVDADAIAMGVEQGLDLRAELLEDHAADHAGQYDVVTMAHVIEHVPDPVGFLTAARSLLRPEGRLWLATPNIRSLGHRLFGTAWVGLDVPRHLVLFDARSLRLALEKAGFGDVRDMPPDDIAAPQFAWSSTLATGRKPDLYSPEPLTAGLRARAAIADRIGRRDPSLREEIVVLARCRSQA